MRSSKRNEPCPMCGRSKDSDCRFDDDVIFCHQGSSHGPPSNLHVGDVVTRQGREWALVKTNAGFAGVASVFRPHRPLKKKHFSPSQRVHQERKRRHLINAKKKLIEDFIKLSQAALDVLEFETAPPDELKASFALIEKAYWQGIEIKEVIGFDPDLKKWISLINEANKQLFYQYNDQLNFQQNFLGEPLCRIYPEHSKNSNRRKR